jgi:(5-formylfuran-3-yl)methyl phosphate synthase
MIRLLASVRDAAEARLAARHGADLIDCKDPAQGALGGLAPATIGAIVQALRNDGATLPVSATIGDVPMDDVECIVQRVAAVAACGVAYVKVGIVRRRGARAVLDALSRTGHAIVPVFIADEGIDDALLAHALRLSFPAVMLDSADKARGSLFEWLPMADIARFVAQVRAAGAMAGLAGALRLDDVPSLASAAPSIAGFRSALCEARRDGALDGARLRALAAALRRAQCAND